MALQQPVHGAWVDRVAHVGFQRVVNLGGRGDVATRRTREEGRKKGLFLGDGKVLIAAAAFAGGVACGWTAAVVG